ncbi:16S rRNA (adenine(1518)-N(6)/adenine(1519)-N(6))-dimethyltransferase RsmA [Mycoplasmopsis lipophila]|uniref:16S rRNA (adenine(1518)-N(6)/adenine(1519)-N(6))- dimethyltransferase RsmA n=1 Tax=Mycoplasmopsis lipophila TaxID=2117 RepID=UPI003872B144
MEILKIKAKKQFGQNFLNDENIVKKIIDVIEPKNKKIIEIGPGQGALTKYLIQQAKEVHAFEIDNDMVEILNSKFRINKNLNLFQQDFLKSDLKNYEDFEVVGNIPYNISTDILFKLFNYRYNFKRVVLMVQKEYAQRMVAKFNSNEYSKLTLICNYLAKVKIEFYVNKKSFSPIPKVDSAIISLDFYQDKNDDYEQIRDFFKLCFLHRRKKLLTSLMTKYSKEKILSIYRKYNWNELIRIQELNLDQVLNLFKDLELDS